MNAINAVTGAQVTGTFSLTGSYSITPDVNGWTDYNSRFPATLTGTYTTTGGAYASSADIPSASVVKKWAGWATAVGADFTGTYCDFQVLSLTHADYELDTTSSPTYPVWVRSPKA